MMVSVSHGEDRMCRACVRTLLKVGRHLRGCICVEYERATRVNRQ